MSHKEFSHLKDYRLVHSDQDIRGWKLMDAPDHVVGTVDDLVVDTRAKKVEAVILDNGRRLPAKDIALGNKVAYLCGNSPIVRVY